MSAVISIFSAVICLSRAMGVNSAFCHLNKADIEVPK